MLVCGFPAGADEKKRVPVFRPHPALAKHIENARGFIDE
jgi:hypothetical protein